MASEFQQNQADRSFSKMGTNLHREAEEHENDHNMRTEPSSPQIELEYSLQQVKSAGISPISEVDFKPTTRLYLAFGTLAVITLMVALDGTSLSVALPVSSFPILAICNDQY